MNINLAEFKSSLEQVINKHANDLAGKSGLSEDYEDGFIAALQYVLFYIVPAFETQEKDEATALEESMQNEIDDIKAKYKFGLE